MFEIIRNRFGVILLSGSITLILLLPWLEFNEWSFLPFFASLFGGVVLSFVFFVLWAIASKALSITAMPSFSGELDYKIPCMALAYIMFLAHPEGRSAFYALLLLGTTTGWLLSPTIFFMDEFPSPSQETF